MSKAVIIPDEIIINKIYLLRGVRVMLDRDLAEMYGVIPTRLREQVKRNIAKFPEKFMFQLTQKEVIAMVSQNAIPSKRSLGGYSPYAFTEYGILMLANVLKSKKAIAVSIKIIELFIRMREMVFTHKDILLKLEIVERKLTKHDDEIAIVFKALKQMLQAPKPEPRRRIGFKTDD